MQDIIDRQDAIIMFAALVYNASFILNSAKRFPRKRAAFMFGLAGFALLFATFLSLSVVYVDSQYGGNAKHLPSYLTALATDALAYFLGIKASQAFNNWCAKKRLARTNLS